MRQRDPTSNVDVQVKRRALAEEGKSLSGAKAEELVWAAGNGVAVIWTGENEGRAGRDWKVVPRAERIVGALENMT